MRKATIGNCIATISTGANADAASIANWRVHELALVDAEGRTRRQTVRLARLSCTSTSADSDEATQFVLELAPGFNGRLRCGALGPGQSVDVAVDVERLRGALLRPGAGLAELLVDVTAGFISEHDATLAFAARRRFLPDEGYGEHPNRKCISGSDGSLIPA